jgi:bacteriocin-like protein
MANQQDPKNVENEPKEELKPIDELTDEELDQIVGGDGTPNTFVPKPVTPPSIIAILIG